MPNNMILLETIALTQAAASVTFDNLPTSGYTDLKVVLSVRNSAGINAWDDIYVDINGSSSNFTSRVLYGTGSAANSISFSSSIAQVGEGNAGTANTFSNTEIYFPNYLSTTTAKSFSADSVSENNATASLAQLGAGLWNPGTQAAISSLTFRTFTSGNFVANSTFSLYGVAALGTTPVLAPKADGGNVIENDGTYWIHTFTSSGTFTPQTGLTCDALVVAGGAGGGNGGSAGGGAGGFRALTGQSLTIQNYAVTIGAGGAGGAGGATNQDGTVGSNSVFSSITSAGGGTASSSNVRNGGDGGSGGGGYNGSSGGSGNTPTTSPSQGSNGGSGSPSAPNYGGGGGGGASAVGVNGTATSGGNGGAGTANSYSGSSVTYAGGGGGATYQGGTAGLGGAGGGGNAGTSNTNTAGDPGTANTGGGGGGASTTSAYAASGGAGGSGIIIIRYPIA